MHDIAFLHDVLVLLVASIAITIVFKQMGLSPALGYLVAGAAIGPFGFGILTSVESTKAIAELGIVFLLFAIGLELTIDKIIEMRRYIVGFGGLQIILTSFVIYYVCCKFFKIDPKAAIVIGTALSLSSTAIVMQIIAENAEQTTRVGRLSFSVLLMQDLAVVPILVLLPILAKTDIDLTSALSGALANATIALMIIFAIGRSLLRPLYRMIAESKSDVLFLSFTMFIVLGASYLSNHFGLSFALGAFVAGLMVAETEYKYRVEEEILSLKSLLMGLFFMTIGMSFDFDALLQSLPLIVLASLCLIIIKFAIIVALCWVFRFPLAPAVHTGLLLAQGGEFAFVVFVMAVDLKFISHDISQFLMTVVTLTMALTPFLTALGRKIKAKIYTEDVLHDTKIKAELEDLSKHVVIIGFTKIGRIVSYILRKKRLPYLVLENNNRVVRVERNNNYNIYYGDAMNAEILDYVGVGRAEAVVIAMEDELTCVKITRFIREHYPHVQIIAKTELVSNTDRFKRVGANIIVSKNLETGLQLSRSALATAGMEKKEIDAVLSSFRDINSDVMNDIILREKTSIKEALFDK